MEQSKIIDTLETYQSTRVNELDHFIKQNSASPWEDYLTRARGNTDILPDIDVFAIASTPKATTFESLYARDDVVLS